MSPFFSTTCPRWLQLSYRLEAALSTTDFTWLLFAFSESLFLGKLYFKGSLITVYLLIRFIGITGVITCEYNCTLQYITVITSYMFWVYTYYNNNNKKNSIYHNNNNDVTTCTTVVPACYYTRCYSTVLLKAPYNKMLPFFLITVGFGRLAWVIL